MEIREFLTAWREVVKPITIGDRIIVVPFRGYNYSVHYSRRSADSPMGRFGGGWQWNVGVQVGGRTVILNLLVAELIISIRERL